MPHVKKTTLATYLRGVSFTLKESRIHKYGFLYENIKMGI